MLGTLGTIKIKPGAGEDAWWPKNGDDFKLKLRNRHEITLVADASYEIR